MSAFSKLLIANRGEIAVRILRTARALGCRTVAVYSDADRDALHVRLADEAVRIGPAPARDSYLRGDRIIEAALQTGAQALHPGYGFLSENAEFARAVQAAGLVFIGPDPASIAAMGDKSAAKARMLAAGVPCIPGYHGEDQSDAAFAAHAHVIGFPLMIKAAAGGGGRGMRLVHAADALPALLQSARAEAMSAFGDGRLLLEKALVEARHVEVQVFGDRRGEIVHLGERDCSIQRRHQKIVEEAPSPAVDDELRARMGAAAVAAAKAVDYVGAGTVEFMLDRAGQFYFLEMNTRLQVEHPVTEAVFGVDLVEWQLRIARGESLPLTQDELLARRRGWAIEVRLCSEDPARDFLPQTGIVQAWRPADGIGIRVDHGLVEGQRIGPDYDSLQAKLIAHGPTRDEARLRLLDALERTAFLGVASNQAFLVQVLRTDAFVRGDFSTAFIERRFADGVDRSPATELHGALACALLHCLDAQDLQRSSGLAPLLLGWCSSPGARQPIVLRRDGSDMTYQVASDHGIAIVSHADRQWRIGPFDLNVDGRASMPLRVAIDGRHWDAHYARVGRRIWLSLAGVSIEFEDRTLAPVAVDRPASAGSLLAPMDGRIIAVHAAAGASVERGECIIVLEAMKMQFPLCATADGMVDSLACAVGDQVKGKQLLAVLS